MASVAADYQRFHDSPTAHHAAALQTPRQHRSPSQNYEGRRSAKPRMSSHRLDASLHRRRSCESFGMASRCESLVLMRDVDEGLSASGVIVTGVRREWCRQRSSPSRRGPPSRLEAVSIWSCRRTASEIRLNAPHHPRRRPLTHPSGEVERIRLVPPLATTRPTGCVDRRRTRRSVRGGRQALRRSVAPLARLDFHFVRSLTPMAA